MRAFIAIEVPEVISNYLKQLQKEVNKNNERASLPKQFHLTLKFLGEVKINEVENMKEKLSKIKFKPFNLKINKIGFFPNERKIRVVWIGFQDNRDLMDLQNQVTKATQEYKENHPFSPHITLARIKFIKDKKGFLERLKNIKVQELEFTVDKFKLIKSELMPEGPIYTVLAEFA